ncbi:hypothetical protein HN371_04350 [Candidatus Poribacteria bacterium]|nr:hypothetical protein [Candidatus Poribacteria bacterium]MBT5536098.1 hypothetical protein [Candidatus Poribacteria bacterium]MBT5711565.1 hypothetical protein [Candidatus Poribacteria bacterium]MBT7099635.1 hypothetical protein [Candidatus Poribacteria bacterium]MBT7806697.1 hypothetical protein [Candidatus Poribacteria bacterium]
MRVVLSPIPRLPWRVQRLDADGRWQGVEIHDRGPSIVSCLRRAYLMMGHDIAFERVSAASGEALRFTWQGGWGHEAEAITPLDAAASACEALGFSHTALRGESHEATLGAIVASIDAGVPALLGMDRDWELVVGYDTAPREFLCDVSGFEQATVGEELPAHRSEDELRAIAMPVGDWYGATYAPGQVARNPAFVVRGRTSHDVYGEISLAVRALRSVCESTRSGRADTQLRRDTGSDFLGVRDTEFVTGADAIRIWAGHVAELPEATHDFGVIHANDTTLRLQIERGHDAAKYLAWAAGNAPDAMRPHLTDAHSALAEAANIPLPVCGWTCDLHTEDDLREAIRTEASLVYIVDDDRSALLGKFEARSRSCPWGYSVLPEPDEFAAARDEVVHGLRRIADLRDIAVTGLRDALDAESQ